MPADLRIVAEARAQDLARPHQALRVQAARAFRRAVCAQGRRQIDVACDLGVSVGTLRAWCTGAIAVPAWALLRFDAAPAAAQFSHPNRKGCTVAPLVDRGAHRRSTEPNRREHDGSAHVALSGEDTDSPSVLGKGENVGGRKPCAVFLDPPYDDDLRSPELYGTDDGAISAAVREWALANGDDPDLRIALCGYAGEHEMPGTWTEHAWKGARGYASDENANRERERIWFSPHCLRLEQQTSLFAARPA